MNWEDVDYTAKSLYLIQEWRVINKASWAENISEWIRIIARELWDTAMKVLSRFESGDNNIWVVLNKPEVDEYKRRVFIISLDQPLNQWDEVPETTNDELAWKSKKYN